MSDLEPLKEHYRALVAEYDDPARACSWRDSAVARRNFAAVCELFAHETEPFTVYEVGCGFGTLSEFLGERVPHASYSGSDILEEMIVKAKERDPNLRVEQRDIIAAPPPEQYDYVVISGVFNLRMSNDDTTWFEFVKELSRAAFAIAKKGFACNFLTTYVDWSRDLGYYQDPSKALEFAIRDLSRFSEIRHSYYPWEFSLLAYHKPKPLRFGDGAITIEPKRVSDGRPF